MGFRFKQFEIEDTHSTLRVGTDTMILGSWAEPDQAGNILDIGTGCGILALMMAQKSNARIDAIDIDRPSCIEAEKNFLLSPWKERLRVINDSLQLFAKTASCRYDYIITNPPFYSNQLKSPSIRKNSSRHDLELGLTEILHHVTNLLTANGRFALILPFDTANDFLLLYGDSSLHTVRKLIVSTKPGNPPKRMLLEFGRDFAIKPEISELTILDNMGKFSTGYLLLTHRFHCF
ncbi:MAG: methyltransferase [Bacteroidota bacterium]